MIRMELFDEDIDQDLDAREQSERRETRQSHSKGLPSRSRKTGKFRKKRHASRKTTGRRRTATRSGSAVVPSGPSTRPVPRPEPPPIIPQPSLGAEDEEPTTDEGEQRQEPPPPTASTIVGDDDDLFEYVI
jgi:hypothetical protein